MKKGKELAYEIYTKLKMKYITYQFEDFVDILQLEHCVIIFRKEQEFGELKFMIEISTDPFKIFKREIVLYREGERVPGEVKDYEEYTEILSDARKLAKGKSIET